MDKPLDSRPSNEVAAVGHLSKIRRLNALKNIDRVPLHTAMMYYKKLAFIMDQTWWESEEQVQPLETAYENLRRVLFSDEPRITFLAHRSHFQSIQQSMAACNEALAKIPDEYVDDQKKTMIGHEFVAFVQANEQQFGKEAEKRYQKQLHL